MLKMQKAKNELIKNFEKDIERISDLVSIEEDISAVKEEMDEVSDILNEKIEIEKKTLDLKE